MRRRIPFPSGDFRPGASCCTPFRCVRRRRLGRHGCQSCDLGSALIKSRGAAGLRSARRYAGESALFRGHVVCGPTSSLRYLDGRDRSRWPRSRRSHARGDGLCVRPHRYALANRERTRRGGGAATAQQRNPVRVKVAADGVVEHVVLGSHRDNVKPMARVCRGVAGPPRVESMLRERGANNQCRSGLPYAAAETRLRWRGADWRKQTCGGLAAVIARTSR